jgi:hypothetical protein
MVLCFGGVFKKNTMKRVFITIIKFVFGKRLLINFKSIFLLNSFQNLSSPKTYNEKINYRKLNPYNPLYGFCSNKYLVKFYVSSTIGSKYTIETLWIGNKLSLALLENITDGFAIKITNSSGKNNYKLIERKSDHNLESLVDIFNKNVQFKYGKYSDEGWYDQTNSLIMIEKLITDKLSPIYEVKIYCFNGPNGFDAIIRTIKDRTTNKTNAFYDLHWQPLNIGYMNNKNHNNERKPQIFDELIRISKLLSKPFDHVRLDFLIQDENIYLGEMTFADTSGFIKFNSNLWDRYFGDKWKLKKDF